MRKYNIIKYIIDLSVWAFMPILIFYIKYDFQEVINHPLFIFTFAFQTTLKAFVIFLLKWHKTSWRWISTSDFISIALGISVVSISLVFINLILGLPLSDILLEGLFSFVTLISARFFVRFYVEREVIAFNIHKKHRASRIIIIGTGDNAVKVAKEMLRNPNGGRIPIGYLDDNEAKLDQIVTGLPVLGKISDLPEIISKYSIDEILIAIPSTINGLIRQVVDMSINIGVKYKIIPDLKEILAGRFSISMIREVDVEDLLRREVINIHNPDIEAYLHNKLVLVTGAGGSIGSEIVRQIATLNPAGLILLGRGENSIYLIEQEIKRNYPHIPLYPIICDVRDISKLETVFIKYQPSVVFHAAAHKHVPLMEMHPDEAILNNVLGTKNITKMALKYSVRHLVNISTDKAVNPTSVMGASKRVAEYIVSNAALEAKANQNFVSVRFGNVLGSRGSVVPLFKNQIKMGGPVTVTHPEMTRYFMTIPEASQLVLQAGGLSGNGNVYVLDMGQPVKIIDLARDLIRLSGFEPEVDIPIVLTGMRPGEKLYEELLTAEEGTMSSQHEKIFVARNSTISKDILREQLEILLQCAMSRDTLAICNTLKVLIPTFVNPYETHVKEVK